MTANVLVDGSLPSAAAANEGGITVSSDSLKELKVTPLPRSASYTQLPTTTASHPIPESNGIKRTFSENVLANPAGNTFPQPFSKQASGGIEDVHDRPTGKNLLRRQSTRSQAGPKITVSKFALGPRRGTGDSAHELNNGTLKENHNPEIKRRSVSGSLTSFARKSWISASRSPSPNKREAPADHPGSNNARPPSRSNAVSQGDSENSTGNGHVDAPAKRSNTIGKKSRRPLSAFIGRTSDEPGPPSVPAIPKSYSTDRLPSLRDNHYSSEKPPTVPKSMSSDRLQGVGTESPRKKDDLWGVFRTLDGDFQKFQTRASTLKTTVVRSALLPFLRNYADHPSNAHLRPEDLDRRVNILNKWWTGLLEMLNGRNGESVSGNDRPAILEAVTAIMTRPEWVLHPTPFPFRTDRIIRPSLKSRSTTSLGSTASDFLADSVLHNIRNTYVQNLLAQMAFVVDKMSMRNVAASVVTFCGKATAYAFFYCDGIAEILARLWTTSTEALQRILAENNVRRNADLKAVSGRVTIKFPPCVHNLAFQSLRSTMRNLRCRPQVPIATAYIPWHGPWVGRWAGRDSDLFFVFAKNYYDLACRFLPDDVSQEERTCAPGYILVQAQMLTILDATIRRAINQPSDHFNGPPASNFDEMLGEADASATVLPLPPSGANRLMAENRLIMMLRDCLSASSTMSEKAQRTFAGSFDNLLRAATRHVSLFNYSACFTLCDFMEEAIVILDRYHKTSSVKDPALGWAFWLDVCKLMMRSQNTMTELRLCAFLYSLWSTITTDEGRKRELCLEWLLSETTFGKMFNHWCPMVRAYYMRLLCWKVARLDGSISNTDKVILETLSFRLDRAWCYFLYAQQCAQINGKVSPSTAPCSPAPGRRLLIVRNDVQAAPGGMFLSFDGILSSTSSSTTQATAYERHSSLSTLTQATASQLVLSRDDVSKPSQTGKKRWGLFKNMIPFAGSPEDHSKPNSSPSNNKPANGTEPANENELSTSKPPPTAPPFRPHSFKFSLEWTDRENEPTNKERRLYPPKLPVPAHTYLQSIRTENQVFEPIKPEGAAVESSKYAGRALAEWAILITEFQTFFERRKHEGVPGDQQVETPTLGVETFRR